MKPVKNIANKLKLNNEQLDGLATLLYNHDTSIDVGLSEEEAIADVEFFFKDQLEADIKIKITKVTTITCE